MGIRFISPFKKLLCPFCYHEFHLSEALYRDVTDPKNKVAAPEILDVFRLNPHNDPALANQKIECPIEPRPSFPFIWRVLSKIPFVRRCFVVKTNGKSFGRNNQKYRSCCPKCTLRIPREWGDGDFADKTISIIGLAGSGKSCYLTELIQELDVQAQEVGYDPIALDSVKMDPRATEPFSYVSSDEVYRERYGKDRERGIVPEKTQSVDNDNPQIRIPLIYRLLKGNKKIDLCLYDPPGEDVGKINKFYKDYYYATCASGVLFIVDPFAFPALRNYGDANANNQAIDAKNPIHVLYRLYLENGKLVGAKITTPCAVVLSKFDRFREEKDFKNLIETPGVSHKEGYNRRYYDSLHGRLDKFLAEKRVPLTSQTLGNSLSNFRLFATSALGGKSVMEKGDAGNMVEKYPKEGRPFGIAAPFFWLLYEIGFLPEAKK